MKHSVRVGRLGIVEISSRLLNRNELKKIKTMDDAWERSLYVVQQTSSSDFDYSSFPFGTLVNLAESIYAQSVGVTEEEILKLAEEVDLPMVKQEILMNAAFPEYTFEKQGEMDLWEWTKAWLKTEWKLMYILGISPQDIARILMTQEEKEELQKEAAYQQVETLAKQAAPEYTMEGNEVQQKYAEHMEKVMAKMQQSHRGNS